MSYLKWRDGMMDQWSENSRESHYSSFPFTKYFIRTLQSIYIL